MLTNYSPKDQTYRLAFVFAITLHVLLGVCLFMKLNKSQQFVLEPSVNIIHAVAISDFTPMMQQPPQKQEIEKEPPKPIKPIEEKKTETQTLKIKKDDTLAILQKHMQQEQEREAKELKKQMFKKTAQQTLQQELAREKSMLPKAHFNPKAQGEIDRYKALILQAIASEWIVPEGVGDNAFCKLWVSVGPKGVILKVQLIESSGNELLDRSAKTAVLKASPLPVPGGMLFDNFREIRLTVRPGGVTG